MLWINKGGINMKKSIIVTLALVSAFIISGCGGGDKKPAPAQKPAAQFEQIGYYKSKDNDRSFTIYTTVKNKDEMIKYAKTKAYTDGRVTNVHFFDSKEFTLDNSLFKNHDAAMWLNCKELTDNHRKHMIGTYQKGITGKDAWHDKDAITKL